MTERLLNEQVAQQVRDVFKQLTQPVALLFFNKKDDCDYCEDTRHLLEEITMLSDKLHLTVYDYDEDNAIAQQYKVDKVPGLVIAGLDGDQVLDYGIRMAGIPSGHEFSSLIHDLILVSGRDSGLDQKTRGYLAQLKQPVLLQVFVTPT
jgi:glutaredoxin-like protein